MARNEVAEKIGGQYIRITEDKQASCWDTELGQVCKAYDTGATATAGMRYVALLRLHDWCALLPEKTLDDLDAAIATLTEPDPRRPQQRVTLSILASHVPRQGDHADRYLILPWVEALTTTAALLNHLTSAQQAIHFMVELAAELGALYRHSDFIRPAIKIEKLGFKPSDQTLILNEPGLDSVLDRIPRSSQGVQEDLHRLRVLLIQLLDLIAVSAHAKLPEFKELHTTVPELQARWHDEGLVNSPAAMDELWQLLDGEPYADLDGFSVALRDCLARLAETTTLPEQTNTLRNRPVDPSPSPAQENQPQKLPDHLRLRFVEGTEEFIFPQWLQDEIVLLGTDDGLDPATGAPAMPGASMLPKALKEKLKARLHQRRVYIQRHGTDAPESTFYTITDFDPVSSGNNTRLDGQPLSPLFAALLTPASAVETGGGFRIKLVTSTPGRQDDWSTALQVPPSAVIEPGAPTIAVSVTVSNPTDRVELLTLYVDGMPADWPPAAPVTIRLFERERTQANFVLNVPALRLAGEYQLTVRLISDNYGAQVAVTAFGLTVPPELAFSAELQPEIIHVGQAGVLHLANEGNFARTFSILLRDRANALRFEPAHSAVTLPAYGEGEIHFRVASPGGRPRLLGSDKTHDISAVVAPMPQHHGPAQEFDGQAISRAMVPLWALLLVFLVIAGGILLYSLLAVPVFRARTLTVDGAPAREAIAGMPVTLKWSGGNTCFHTLVHNGVEVQSLTQGADGELTRTGLEAGDELEVRLMNCLLMRTASWPIAVVAAPTPLPAPPTIEQFGLQTQNVERSGAPIGGPEAPPQPESKQILLRGQTGDLCIAWTLAAPFDPAAHTLQIVAQPSLAAVAADTEIRDPTGVKCFPIATTFLDVNPDPFAPMVYRIRIGTTDRLTGQTSISSETKEIQVFRPACTVNTTAPLLLREGPGRSFPERGQLFQGETIYPLTRPLFLREQDDALNWVQAMLANDPRPVWVAVEYLYCPVPIDVLPAANLIPPTPTPTPSPTPVPTPAPTAPPPQPTFTIEPPIINAGGCAMVTWAIQGVKQVFLNGEGVVGEAQRQVCPQQPGEYVYTWLIVAIDGSKMEKSQTLLVNGSPVPPPPSE